jgi:hypothetical protein
MILFQSIISIKILTFDCWNFNSSGCAPQLESVDVRSIRVKDPNWMVNIEKLKRFKKKHGSLTIPSAVSNHCLRVASSR